MLRRFICGTSRASSTASRTSACRAISSRAAFIRPASVIVFAVSRQAGANAVAVARSVRELLPELQRELPGSIRLIPTFDRSQSIVNSLHDVQATLAIAFALVIFVIFVFLGRASDTLIPMVALPMSFLITFRRDVGARLFDQQPYPDGADARHRVPGR